MNYLKERKMGEYNKKILKELALKRLAEVDEQAYFSGEKTIGIYEEALKKAREDFFEKFDFYPYGPQTDEELSDEMDRDIFSEDIFEEDIQDYVMERMNEKYIHMFDD